MTSTPVLPATRLLAEFAAGVRYRDLPLGVRDLLPILLVDYFRAGAVGRTMPWTRKAERVLRALSGAPTSSILYDGLKTDAVRAAYLNGIIAGSLDWDDSHIAAIIHPGVVVWPAALAVAEVTGADGQLLLEAVVAGYETAIRIGMSVQPDHAVRGFQGTPTCGVFGAAVAAGRLFGFDAAALQNALGIAASYASGLAQFWVSGSDVKRLHAGKAAAAGVEVALLVRAGLTGPPDAIEGEQGFGHATSDTFEASLLTAELGTHFWMTGISLKVHAGTVRLQAAIEAGEALAREGVCPDKIASVEIGVPGNMMGKATWNEPVDQQAAQLSVPFAVAMALVLTPRTSGVLVLGIEEFAASVVDSAIRELSARTTCVVDEAIERAVTKEYVPARVTLRLKDGRTLEKIVIQPKGCPENPITLAEVCARYRLAAAPLRNADESEAWLRRAEAAHELASASELMR